MDSRSRKNNRRTLEYIPMVITLNSLTVKSVKDRLISLVNIRCKLMLLTGQFWLHVNTSSVSMVTGKINRLSHLTLTSQMPEHGIIFSDGIEADYLEFNSGIIAEIGIAEKKGMLVI